MRHQCERFVMIKTGMEDDARRLIDRSVNAPTDTRSRIYGSMSAETKRAMAKKLHNHVSRCKLCSL